VAATAGAAGAAAFEVGTAVGVVLDSTGVVDTAGVAAPVGEATELVPVGLDCAVVTPDDAWFLAAAVG
jgi:hypothetical protein